jgi:putative RecB family exonuclease
MSTITDLRAEREKYWSQSRIGLFLMCSLKYAFSYVYKVESEFTPLALVFGSAVHRTLEMLALSCKERQTMSGDDCRDLFAKIWRRQLQEDDNIRYAKGENADTCCMLGMDVVSAFHGGIDETEEVVTVSEAMAVPLIDAGGNVMSAPLIGEADLVVRDKDGQLVIVDWKTSGQRWPIGKNGGKGKADTEVQPTALIYAYRQTHGIIPDFRYDIVVKNKTPVLQQVATSRNQDDFHRLVEIVKAIEIAVQAEAFLPQPGFLCPSCQHRGACARWHRDRARVSVRMAA